MHRDMEKELFTKKQITDRTCEMAHEIINYYSGKPLTVVALSNGALIFAADLIRQIDIPLQFDNIMVSSYSGTESTGNIQILSDLKLCVKDRYILIVDDILDTGKTLSAVVQNFADRGAVEIKTCVLLDKKARRTSSLQADFVGFPVGDEFVVGYGLDYNEMYRNLPYIGVLRPEAINHLN